MGSDKREYDVVVAGYTCIDLTPEFRKGEKSTIAKIFKPGQLTEIEGLSFIPGGVVPNTGMALKKFNKRVYLSGLVGDDFMGNALNEWLSQYGYTEGIQVTEKEGTAFSIVLAPPGIDRIFLESTGCNQIFDASHIDYAVVSRSRMFHFGYPPLLKQFYRNGGSQLAEMFTKVQKSGAVTSLDFSLPDPDSESGRIDWHVILQRILPLVDIFAPSLEEAVQIMMPEALAKLSSTPGPQDIIDQIPEDMIMDIGRRMVAYGTKILMLKAAHRGIYLFTGDISSVNDRLGNTLDEEQWNHHELWCDAYVADPEKIKNATGAGDTAIAAFLSALLDGNGPVSSLKYATLAGRNNLYCNNMYEELPGWEDMTDEIHKGNGKIIE